MSDDDMAVDLDGRALPIAPADVRQIVLKKIEEGEIMAIIVKNGDDISVQVMGPPSRELLDVLERVTAGYRRAIQGH